MEKELTHHEVVQKGGNTTLKKHGVKHFKKISAMGAKARWGKKSKNAGSLKGKK